MIGGWRVRKFVLIIGVGLGAGIVACSSQKGDAAAPSETAPGEIARDQPGVHNVLLFDEDVISGSVPHGEDGFRSLEAMGVRTIISVDGSRPDLELAEAHGMRYIHVPIRYNGIEEDQRITLARAMREAEGPVFIHCHHGKHRGPAAAAYALVACERITPDQGVALMKEAGTSRKYPGLYGVVATAGPVSDAEIIDAIGSGRAELVAEARVEGLVANMAAAGVSWDHMKAIRDAGWMVPPDHPDLVPAAEAGILENVFRTLIEDEHFDEEPADYVQWMRDSHEASLSLENALVAGDAAEASQAMERLGTACDACHAAYRNE